MLGTVGLLVLGLPVIEPKEALALSCPSGMVSVRGKFCIDQYEAATNQIRSVKSKKTVRKHSPYKPVTDVLVKAVSQRGRVPQAHISRNEAELACYMAGKRLCTDDEWKTACKGKKPTVYPYGKQYKKGYCNDAGKSAFNLYYGPPGSEAPRSAYTWENMNDPRLNQMKGTLAPAGYFSKCRNSFKVYDIVGNLHEWTSAPSGTFRGGYYLDTQQHGDGCDYVTTAHNAKYHDYSTGFRCCKGGQRSKPALLAKFERSGGGASKKAASPSSGAEAAETAKNDAGPASKKDRTARRKRTFGKKPKKEGG